MSALNLKLWRDLVRWWSQALTIALVVASAVAGWVTTLSAVASLAQARDDFYAQARFADVFAQVRRAPLTLVPQLEAVPGVAQVQVTLEHGARLSLPGLADPIQSLLMGVDARRARQLNQILLRRGATGAWEPAPASPGPPDAQGEWPVWLAEGFAQARGLPPGSVLTALVNGRQQRLRVVAWALSPQTIFAGRFGMPDPGGFAHVWVDEQTLSAAEGLTGAFTHLVARLAPGHALAQVQPRLQRLLEPYGAREVVGREHQSSHQMLDAEIQEQRLIGRVLPAIFLAVAAFLLQGVVSRLVGIQREQISTLKALGYGEGAILWHYLQWVGVIVALGLLIGVGVAQGFGRWLTALYAEFFRFPSFRFQMPWDVIVQAVALTAGAAAVGTWQVIAATARLPPAVAMSPPAPAVYRLSWADRWGWTGLSLGTRRVLRQIQRRPWRTALATASIAASVGIVILGNFVRDAMALIVDTQFHQAQRADVQVWTLSETSDDVVADMLHQPGVWRAEGLRMMAVRLVNGTSRERVMLRGLEDEATLNQVVDVDQQVVAVRGLGLTLTDRLAAKLGLRVGQSVQVDLLEGPARTVHLRVDATVADMMGLNAVMRRSVLHRVLDEAPVINSLALGVDRDRVEAMLGALQDMPRIAGAFSKASLLRNMETFSARNVRIMSGVMTLFAVVIAVGVVYNQARMALSERRWELASLRVLGFTQAEVAAFLLGELAVVVVLAMPLGLLVGRGLVHGLARWMRTDQFAFPVMILPRTDAWAIVCVMVTALASAWVVRRQIDRLDLVAALKTRE